jgi:hypothetical protein
MTPFVTMRRTVSDKHPFEAFLYHGGFFADLATRLKELAKACRAHGYFVMALERSIRFCEAVRGRLLI